MFDKKVKKVTYLPKISNFGTLKFMKTCLVIRFLGTFCPGIKFSGEILPGLDFALAAHQYLPLLGSRALKSMVFFSRNEPSDTGLPLSRQYEIP